jgi:hypothetical protein
MTISGRIDPGWAGRARAATTPRRAKEPRADYPLGSTTIVTSGDSPP